MRILLIAFLLAGCAGGRHAVIDTASLISAEVLIAADLLQTADIRGRQHVVETNPFLGKHPSTLRIGLLGGVAMLGTATGWLLLPPGWRSVFAGVVSVVEIDAVVNNAVIGLRIRL